MKALVIYDTTGRILTVLYSETKAPQGVPCMFVDIPEGAALDRIDVTDTKNPKPIFSFLPVTDMDKVKADVDALKEALDQLNQVIDYDTCTLEELQRHRQDENKAALGQFLRDNPLLWLDGELYGVTKEDQDEMITDKAAYDLKQAIGASDWKLEWHNIRKSCREFSEEEFYGLLNAIVDFVYPFRRLQEEYKEQIYACSTKEDVLVVELLYELEAAK